MEGSTRVLLIITGPDVPKGEQSDVMINDLDFYPKILSLAGAKLRRGKHPDGADISSLYEKIQLSQRLSAMPTEKPGIRWFGISQTALP